MTRSTSKCMMECQEVIRTMKKGKAEWWGRDNCRALLGKVSFFPVIGCLRLGYKFWEICKPSFVKPSFISLVQFQVNAIFFISICLNAFKFCAVSSFKKWPGSKKNAKNFTLFCVTTE